MPSFRLPRRTVLRGAGGIALALPWLEIMGPRRARADAGAGTPRRLVTVFQPGGTVRRKYTPTGNETAFTMGPILRPLEPFQQKLVIVDGLDMKSAIGEQHQAGIVALLTGTPQRNGGSGYAAGPSIDQVIAPRLLGARPKSSLELAIRWATGRSKGRLHPINALNFEDNAGFAPIPPRLDPKQIFDDLFGQGAPSPGAGGGPSGAVLRKRSILDYVGGRFEALAGRLGGADRQRLEQHLTKVREIERALVVEPGAGGALGACQAPARVDTSDYNPRTGLGADDEGKVADGRTDAAIPKVGKFMMDMLVTALSCDITAVATLQWSDTEAKHTFPWLGLRDHHHYYQHDGGFRAAECERIATWYSEQHRYLLEQMAAIDRGGHSLLDESVVFFGSEIQDPPSHGKTNMPFVLAGGGGLRTGRWLRYDRRPHNDLLVSLLNLFGDSRRTFGNPEYNTGPLPDLL